ncbi:sporulation integral membrane protein YlbJ [Clostridium sp. LBM24168]
MEILFYILLIIIILLLFFLLKDRNLFITIICSIFIIQIILAPKICIDGAINGVLLFFYKVFPSLFSFLIVSNIIINCDGIHIYAKLFGKILCRPLKLPQNCSFTLIISMLCGYPLGAKYACDLYESKSIHLNTLQRLLNIASNSSPLFMLGSIGISMFKSTSIGYIFLLSNLISCMIMGVMLPSEQNYKNINYIKNSSHSKDTAVGIFKTSIENSVKTCLSIGGFVTTFSVVNNILNHNSIFNLITMKISSILGISKDVVSGTLLGIVEMTNGCNLVSSSDTDIYIKIFIVSFLFTFSGFSIISQVYSFTYKFNVSMKIYTIRKILHGIICSSISIVIFKIYETVASTEIFSYYYESSDGRNGLFIIILFILILPIVISEFKKLFHII